MKQLSHLGKKIAGEMRADGPISFARFMKLALYCPVFGYYEAAEDTVGRSGDFQTSVSAGSLFGELLAFQFADWLEEADRRNSSASPLRLVEAGAHGGQLAHDILGWLRLWRPKLFARIEYWILEPSARPQAWQQLKLAEFADRVRWGHDFSALTSGVRGLIFSNELLDAMPVERWGWDSARQLWFEWGVGLEDQRFVWAKLPRSSATAIEVPSELQAVLPNGYVVELCPEAQQWWRAAASSLVGGRLLTIDYGLTGEDRFAPERQSGTLRAYYRHRVSTDLLARPGEQDLTAHICFPDIIAAGETCGLRTEKFVSQEQFLTSVAAQIWNRPGIGGEWTPHQTRQFQTLTHPQHLGRPFRVLVQSRDE